MNRLQAELHRLFLLPAEASEGRLIDDTGHVRALVMALSGPADWEALGKVWRGVQTDLDLPAPAIAVSGTDALQLWFSLQAPVDAQRGAEFLARLGARYLAGTAPARLRLLPSATSPPVHAELVPAPQAGTENWSAFVAPDLAPVFADTPWLDIPPGIDGQADLLARLQSIKPAAFEAAMQSLRPLPPPPVVNAPIEDAKGVDPRRFLQQVLNDTSAPLALRIEAAKALLQSPGAAG
ncbi:MULTISPECIES: hypothetical protein [unclassified Roseateles]|uniref:hypothetical protein n=1 Tax=unclassified Roseateles TaxID=2626991 RepID=UPI0006FE2285|nr:MULTISPECIES: hypothetical protein [unclassified Roseateles]KQW46283.1 hypothetical protein ASC81_07665 [Pelomonas sp. Root405]KRA73332.1 hypothetical protein ASD88_07665 [Pelomonas sp. Root662]